MIRFANARIFAAALLTVSAWGCEVGPNYHRPRLSFPAAIRPRPNRPSPS